MDREKINKISENSGVYLFKNKKGNIIYVGKAANLKRRVGSYARAKDEKSTKIWNCAEKIQTIETETVIEALIKEADLIKKHKPFFNIKENDDRSFLYVVITKEEYPRVLLERGRSIKRENYRSFFGPFVYSSEIKNALKIIRKIFPYSTHKKNEINKSKPCFYYQINLCPGNCFKRIDKKDYLKTIKNIELFFKGEKKRIISSLEREMKELSKKTEYEKADEVKNKIQALRFIQDTVLVSKRDNIIKDEEPRVEGYDISNISGSSSVGAMTVFKKGIPQKEEYRLFEIKEFSNPNDTGMIKEVIRRRINREWEFPELIVVDGGKGQISSVKKILKEKGLKIPVVGVVKGKSRKEERIIGKINKPIKEETILSVQKEAHRFAINYHRKKRSKNFYK